MYGFRWAEQENRLNCWLINPARKLKEENIWINTEQLIHKEASSPGTQQPERAIKKNANGIIHMLYSH